MVGFRVVGLSETASKTKLEWLSNTQAHAHMHQMIWVEGELTGGMLQNKPKE